MTDAFFTSTKECLFAGVIRKSFAKAYGKLSVEKAGNDLTYSNSIDHRFSYSHNIPRLLDS